MKTSDHKALIAEATRLTRQIKAARDRGDLAAALIMEGRRERVYLTLES
jgi:hypothetical protein